MIYLTPGFRKKLAGDEREYIATAKITLMDGTVLNLTDTEIWSDGFSCEDAVSQDDSFGALGATVINAATLIVDNTKDQFTTYDFINADVIMYIALPIEENGVTRIERIKMGTYRVDEPTYNEATISLSMLDYMEQFDRPYSQSQLVYPATLIEIVRDACNICGVTLGTLTFPHSTYEIPERPTDEACTFREVIGWVACIAGCFAKCNRDGQLELKWFNTAALEDTSGTDGGIFDAGTPYYTTGDNLNGGSFNPWNDGDAADGGDFTTPIPLHYVGGLYTQNICVDETVITGVSIEVEDNSDSAQRETVVYSAGNDGYRIHVSKNPFITTTNAQEILNWLGAQLIGLRFRKSNVTHTDDPSIEAGDVGLLFDSKNREFPILITRVNFEIGSPQTVVCASETPAHNSATRYTEATKNYVESRKQLKEQKNSYEQALEELAEDIASNAKGLYCDEIEDPDNPGAYIYCLHDKPQIEQSPVQIRLSTVGIVVTANGTATTPTWYGFRVNGDLLARVIQTMNLFFDYAHGGTLTLGGANNVNGLIRVLDASGAEIGKWDKDGISAQGDFQLIKSIANYYMRTYIGEYTRRQYSLVEGRAWGVPDNGFAITRKSRSTTDYFSVNSRMGLHWRKFTDCGIDTIWASYGENNIVAYTNNYEFVYEIVIGAGFYVNVESYYAPSTDTEEKRIASKWADEGKRGVPPGYRFGVTNEGIWFNNNLVAYSSSSSRRYKHDIKPIEENELDPHRLLSLQAVQFVWNEDHSLQYLDMRGKIVPGFIAEDVAEIYPSAVIHDVTTGDIESWDERRIIPGMLSLIQEQHTKLEEQEEKIIKQQEQIDDLQKQIDELKRMIQMATGTYN